MIFFVGITTVWIAINATWAIVRFDPYPFILLNLFFTVIELFQGPLIMMSQNRQIERDRDAINNLHAKLDELLARSATG